MCDISGSAGFIWISCSENVHNESDRFVRVMTHLCSYKPAAYITHNATCLCVELVAHWQETLAVNEKPTAGFIDLSITADHIYHMYDYILIRDLVAIDPALSLSRVSTDSRLWCVFVPPAHLPLTLTSVLLSSAVTVYVYPTLIFEHEVTGLSFYTQRSTLAVNWRKKPLTLQLASNCFLVCICELKSWLQKLGALSCERLLMFGGILWLLVALGGFKGPVMFVCTRKSFT